MGRASFLAIAAAIVTVLAAASSADAYPQFQLSLGAKRCNECHYAPAGGGLINGWGREQAGDEISMWGGDGGFLHGVWQPPSWLSLGVDLRSAAVARDVGNTAGGELAVFPMQFDLYQSFRFGPITVQLTEGLRGTVYGENPTLISRFVSRDHWIMWRPKPTGWYARVGRFFAPYGLRLVEHVMFVREKLGFGNLEETYGVSGGWVTDSQEIHVTAFTPDFARPVGENGSGGAAYYERRIGEKLIVGGQTRLVFAPEKNRIMLGGIGKYWLEGPKLLFMAELDGVHETMTEAQDGDTRLQLASYVSATWMPTKGLMAGLFWDRFDQDLGTKGDQKDAFGLQVNWFPYAHFEAVLLSRMELIDFGSGGDTAAYVMLQLHYYL